MPPTEDPIQSPARPELSVDLRYSVVLTGVSGERLRVAVEIRDLRPELSPAAALELIDAAPSTVRFDLNWWDAKSVAAKLRFAGGIAEIRDPDGEFVYEHYRPPRESKPYPG